MKLRHLIFMFAALASLAFGAYLSPALAQSGNETARFKNVVLWLYPEYDDPRLLVMLEGKMDGVTAPVRVRFLVPAAAEMYSAGSMDAQGKYSGGPPDRKASEIAGWDEISYELTTDTFRVEYYDAIIRGQPDKMISYDFRTLYPISDLRAIVQQPKKATNFTVTPKGQADTGREGFTVYSSFFNNLSTDQPLHFDIAYTRSETKPSLSQGSSTMTLIIGLVSGAIVIGGIIVWMLKSRQLRPAPVRAPRSHRRRAARQGNQGKRFCPQCGQLVAASDKFCPSCGNKLRDSS